MNEQTGIYIAIVSYLVLAISTLFDKFLVTKTFRHPLSYAFWLGMLGLAAFILLPLDFSFPKDSYQWIIDLVAGAAFTLSILYYTKALFVADASFALPMTGSMATVFTGVFAYLLLGERLSQMELLAIALLLTGFWVMMLEKKAITHEAVINIFFAAVFFGIANVSMKFVLTSQPFFSGLAFSRLGAAAVALLLLFLPAMRKAVLESKTVLNLKDVALTLFGNGLGALGMLGIFYAYRFESPTVLNAMQGVQYVFLAILAYFVTVYWPKIIVESVEMQAMRRKILGIAIIIVGVFLLAGG